MSGVAEQGRTRLRFCLDVDPAVPSALRADPDRLVSFLPMEAVGERGGLDLSREIRAGDALSGYTFVANGDVVLAKVTPCFENGKGAVASGLTNGVGFATTEVYTLRPRPSTDARFLDFTLQSAVFRQYGTARLTGAGGLKRVSATDVRNFVLVVPPLDEQRAIADFLDRETARIDTLIEEQQRLIDLLRERRLSVISAALAPEDGWRTGRIKHLGSTNLGKMLDAGRANRGGDQLRPYVRAADVLADGTVNLSDLNEMPFSEAEMGHFDLRAEDILLIEGGATVGRPGFLREDADGIAFQKTVNRLRVGASMSARFCYWVLLRLYESGYYLSHFGAVSFVHLTGEKLREIELAFPALAEQCQIAAYLDEQTSKIDALIAETEKFIELARERRSALITAAVTGQIDVRAEVA